MENVSRETIEEPAPLLFWQVCADDPDLPLAGKIQWLTASYEHCQALAGMSMPMDMLDKHIGVAAVMARMSDLLLAMAGTDPEIDKFIVKWLCFACDQLWALVPADKRQAPDLVDRDNPVYNVWITEINRRIPGLVAVAKDEPRIMDRAGDEIQIIICPVCQTRHFYPRQATLCDQCRAPLNHIQPIPYSTARNRDR